MIGSIASVDSKALESRAVPDVSNMLTGQMSGVTKITPLAAREPKIAAEEASFRTEILSISAGVKSLKEPGSPM